MTPRLRRLLADHRKLQALSDSHARISIVRTEGTPPERYAVEIEVSGLRLDAVGEPQLVSTHGVEIFLPADYPRRPPICRMTTPVFHPNVDPQKICIGDHWSAGETLALTVVRIAEMICWQSYNTRSPLNAKAAAWVEQHAERVPLEHDDLSAGS